LDSRRTPRFQFCKKEASSVNSYEARNTDVIYLTPFHLKSNQTSEEDIVWLKEERRLTEREVGAGRQKKWTLSLRGLTAEQSGRYTCRVSNRAGEINATYKVEVIRKYPVAGGTAPIPAP
jgi:hypothetical protein